MQKIMEEKNIEKNFLNYEWLESNHLGAYSSSTLFNCHSRKYHGLLVAAMPGLKRKVLLSKLDEKLNYGGRDYYLNLHYYLPNVFVPNNYSENLDQEFQNEFCPMWKFENEEFSLIKQLMLVEDSNTLILKYEFSLKHKAKGSFEIRPLLAFRDFHDLQKANNSFCNKISRYDDNIYISPFNEERLFIKTNQAELLEDSCWYWNFAYAEEKKRGYEYSEDLASPCKITIELPETKVLYLAFSDNFIQDRVENLWLKESKKRNQKNHLKFKSQEAKALTKTANSFVVNINDKYSTIVAGYHWFGSWGRDTMISLPGIFMKTKYQEDFKKVLRYYLDFKQDGLIPNIIGASKNQSAYNSVDASLWLFWAMHEFASITNNKWIKNEFWEDMKNILQHYLQGLPEKIKFCDNGLIYSGNAKDSLSWMDACIDGHSVIPRYGFLVEINALWYNAIAWSYELAKEFKDSFAKDLENLMHLIKANFESVFYNKDAKHLADYVRDEKQNLQFRPNQIFAISLPYTCIDEKIGKEVLSQISYKLFCPKGLRTLDSSDPDYKGIYQGDQRTRDLAYHNGSLWPWLLGAYCDALLRYEKSIAKSEIQNIIANFDPNLIAEIYDGDAPHQARGCISQAWSLAEIRRSAIKIGIV